VRSDEVSDLLILKSWRDSRALIKLKLRDTLFELEVWTNVAIVEPGRLVLAIVGENTGTIGFGLRGATFRYQDPREADEPIKDDVESKVVCALSVLLADGIEFVLYEWRVDAWD